MQRRDWIQGAVLSAVTGTAMAALGALGGCASGGSGPGRAKVVVIGGGFGGATAAKYLRLLSDHTLDVMLIEPNRQFVSCPISNLVLAGAQQLADITTSYDM